VGLVFGMILASFTSHNELKEPQTIPQFLTGADPDETAHPGSKRVAPSRD